MTSAAGWSRAEVLVALEAFPARLSSAAAAAAPRSVAAGEWGPNEVVRHLIACEMDVHQRRLADLAMGEAPTWDWAEPGPWLGEPDRTLDELLDRFAALRAATIATAAGLDDAGWARSGTHSTLGEFDVRGLLANAVDHDAEHLAGVE